MLSVYPACFFMENGGYSVIFPDLNYLAAEGETLSDALNNATECLASYLYKPLPDQIINPPSKLADVSLEEVEDVITVVNTKPYTDKQKARIKRKQLHLLMKERLDEFKEIDTFRKIADKDPAFRTLYEAYQKTELSNDEQLTCDDVSETLIAE